MPNGHPSEYREEDAREIRALTRMLTELCDLMQKVAPDRLSDVRGLGDWYDRVLERRAEKVARERGEARQAELRQQALAKLTPEEREAVRAR